MISAVVPAYQAAQTIARVVETTRLTGVDRVLVIDDGSRDETAALAEAAGATVLRHAENRGKGAALWTGFQAAQRAGAEAIVTLDADGQHDAAEIPRLLGAWGTTPEALVLGVRDLRDGIMPGRSRLGNQVSTFFLSQMSGIGLRDSQTGFRVYPTSLLSKVAPRSRRFDAETELLLAAVTHGHPILQVAVRTIYPGGMHTHFRDVADTSRIIGLVLRWFARRVVF